MSTTVAPNVEQQGAAVAFLRNLLHAVAPEAVNSHLDPTSFASLSDGKALYLVLSRCEPATFCDVEEMTADVGERGRTNRPLRKENLRKLVSDMTTLANTAQMKQNGAVNDLVILDVDVNVVSGSATLMELVGDQNEDDDEEAAEALAELWKLSIAAIALVALSGNLQEHVDGAMNALSPASSHAIQEAVGQFTAQHRLKQQRQEEQLSMTSDTLTSHADPNGTFGQTNSAPLLPPPSSSFTQSATSPMSVPSLLHTDDSYFRNATTQLRREVEELKEQLQHSSHELTRTRESEASWERRYRMLLSEQAQAAVAPAAVTAGGHIGPEISDLKQRLASKEEAMQALAKKVEEQAVMLKAFKEATSAQEQGLLAMKRKLKNTEEGLIVKSAERREALEKLSIAEDKLIIQVKAKNELENEIEDLRSQITVLRLTQQERQGGGDGDEVKLMNSSFTSNGSMDRVMQLENELDEARAQREALQKQLFIVQKQVTANAMPMADVGAAANDTLKAQIRHLEKEREQLQQQLATALERVEELQNTDAVAALGAVPAETTRSMLQNPQETATSGLLSQASVAGGVDESIVSAGGGGDRDVNDLPKRLRKLRDTTRRDNAMLSSLLLQYGYRNLMLQQHQILLHEDHKAAADALAGPSVALAFENGNPSISAAAAGRGASGGGGVAADGLFTGSYIARQRREVELGLLESVLHSGRQREAIPSTSAAAGTASTSAAGGGAVSGTTFLHAVVASP